MKLPVSPRQAPPPRPCLRCGGLHSDPANKVCERCRATLAKLRDKAFERAERRAFR
jgi:hypothetical protein